MSFIERDSDLFVGTLFFGEGIKFSFEGVFVRNYIITYVDDITLVGWV